MNAAITKAGHEIDAVIASNDGTAGGAIQALEEEKLAGKVIVTGQDAELAACQRIMRGTQAMTIYKPLKNLGDARRPSGRRRRERASKPTARHHQHPRQCARSKMPSIFRKSRFWSIRTT